MDPDSGIVYTTSDDEENSEISDPESVDSEFENGKKTQNRRRLKNFEKILKTKKCLTKRIFEEIMTKEKKKYFSWVKRMCNLLYGK
jgi:hypothetical protein